MQPLRLAVATRGWKASFRETLRGVADLGVEGLQVDLRDELPPSSLTESGRRDFLHQLREMGLQIASAWLALRHPLYTETELDGRVDFVRKTLAFAAQLRIPTLCFRCGRVPDTLDTGSGLILREVLSDLATYGNHLGVSLAITPTTESAAQLAALIAGIKTGPIGIDFDPAHCAMNGQSTAESLRQIYGLVTHVQLRDGLRDFSGGGVETAVGEGTVDWRELIALLSEMDYRGWLTAIRTQGDDLRGDLSRGIRYVQNLLLGG